MRPDPLPEAAGCKGTSPPPFRNPPPLPPGLASLPLGGVCGGGGVPGVGLAACFCSSGGGGDAINAEYVCRWVHSQ